MHELGVLFKLLEQVEHLVMQDESITKVKEIRVHIGELSGIVPYFFKKYFPAAIQDKPLFAEAKLTMHTVKANFLCRECETIFSLSDRGKNCPNCNSDKIDILSGTECILHSIEVEEH